jgi:uncharacterized protein
MRFWDSSALLSLFIDEPTRDRLIALLDSDDEVLSWWGAPLEIASALARRERESLLTADQVSETLAALSTFAAGWHEIVPTDAVRRTAERLLRTHPLRAADSLQLSAAIIAANHDPTSLEMVCLDNRLTLAARREGFTVLDS